MIPPAPIKGNPGSERGNKSHHAESLRYASECADHFCAPFLETMFRWAGNKYLPLPPMALSAARRLFDAKRKEYNDFWSRIDAVDRYQYDRDLFLLAQGFKLNFGEMEYSGGGLAAPSLISSLKSEVRMKVVITQAQAFAVFLEGNYDFVRACFFLGYSLAAIKEYIKGPDFQDASVMIIQAAKEAGMTDDYVVTTE